MEIYAKIGTHSGKRIRVKYKRKPPKVGEHIEFKKLPFERYAKWESGIISEIKDVGYENLYLIERW